MRTLVLAGLLLISSGAMAASTSPYAGTYRNDRMVIEILDKGAGECAGSILVRGEVFPFTAREKAGALLGSFTMDDENVRFRATFDGTTLTFAMEDESYELTLGGGPRAPAAGTRYDGRAGGGGEGEGVRSFGFTFPGLTRAVARRAGAARGDTGVFINGRELPMQDVLGL